MAGPVDVFISHAPADASHLADLEQHLALLKRDGAIRAWHQRLLGVGGNRDEETERRLGAARVVVFLVSAAYFADDALVEREMKPSLLRAAQGAALLIPVLVRACDLAGAPFDGQVTLPRDRPPVTSWPNKDEAWAAVAAGIREALATLGGAPAADPIAPPAPRYESAASQSLVQALDRARARRDGLREVGASTAIVDAEILDLRRKLREGGRLRAGDTLDEGRYRLIEPIGRGGFASVWSAFDRDRGERVAVKVLHGDLARDPQKRERFFRGARVMASLGHEAVVRVLCPEGEDGDYLYFVMELVPGGDLQHAVMKKAVAPDRIVPILLGVGEALAEAHAKGIVHRDVKPANILLHGDGEPRLTDFDLVAVADTTGGTRTGALGTALYAAPEQMSNAKEADARADVYSLGMTALFALHGGELPKSVFRRPEKVIAELSCSDALKHVLTRAIAEEPQDRFEDARAFCEALREAVTPAPKRPIALAPLRDVNAPRRPRPAAPAAPAPVALPALVVPEASVQPEVPRPLADDLLVPMRRASDHPNDVDTAERKDVEPKIRDVTEGGRSRMRITVAAFGVVLGVVALAFSYPALTRSKPGVVPTAQATASGSASAIVAPPPPPSPCSGDMVHVPAGEFTMGSADLGEDTKPHRVKLSAFCLDRTEVTVAAYRACTKEERGGVRCEAAGGNSVSQWCNWEKTDREQHPINCVSWTQADRYCKWTGGELPSEAQWEYAARGTDGRKYPWGNEAPEENRLNACGAECAAAHPGLLTMYKGNDKWPETAPVGTYPDGASPFGALDMAGNVLEWVADWYVPYPAEGKTIPEDPKGPDKPVDGSRRVIRGGGWNYNNASWVRSAVRFRGGVSIRYDDVGFRCARGPKK